MKKVRTIASVFLASLVLVASFGVTLNLHLCAGKVQSVALFIKAKPCKDVKKPCHGTEHHSKRSGCCEEKTIVLKGRETNALVTSTTQIKPSFNLIAVILPVLYSIIDVESLIATPRYAHYKPPFIQRDITVLVQSFLI